MESPTEERLTTILRAAIKEFGAFRSCVRPRLYRTREEMAQVGVPALAGYPCQQPPKGGTPTADSQPRAVQGPFPRGTARVKLSRCGIPFDLGGTP